MSASFPLTIGIAQINPVLGDLSGNTKKILDVWTHFEGQADLIVFPEMVTCGYPPEDLVLKPAFLDRIEKQIKALTQASRDKKAGAVISTPWRVKGERYNAALLIADGKILATILKHELPNYGVFDEQRLFKPGPLPEPVTFRGVNLGIMTCEDMWFDRCAKNLKEKGAQILLVPNGSPFSRQHLSRRLLEARNRAQETGLPLVYVNQVGGQDELVFDGSSFALNERGECLHRSVSFGETRDLLAPDIWTKKGESLKDLSSVNLPRCDEGEVYNALILGLRDYIAKNNFPGVIIGLSGGIDSALSAVIAADALGPEKVRCVMMPSRYTSRESLDDAAALAKSLKMKLDSISIEKPFEAFQEILAPHFDANTPATTDENIQPRARGLILMALSNATGAMVLSTGNKSEMAVGYATLYGDMCGGFNVLKDLYKMQVYALSRWRNENTPPGSLAPKGVKIPENILTKAPTAELKDNQTDQDTLPPYKDLDDILEGLIENEQSVEEIAARGHAAETVLKVWKMLDRAEYKRRQAPPGVKITSRAFGRDRRYPITNHFLNIIEKA
ncbi:MAG: NAD+ synthase [Alphaproteobacteria bacterium]|nr:NAD+ synthase [Alphaproteobacteria bacterium]